MKTRPATQRRLPTVAHMAAANVIRVSSSDVSAMAIVESVKADVIRTSAAMLSHMALPRYRRRAPPATSGHVSRSPATKWAAVTPRTVAGAAVGYIPCSARTQMSGAK